MALVHRFAAILSKHFSLSLWGQAVRKYENQVVLNFERNELKLRD